MNILIRTLIEGYVLSGASVVTGQGFLYVLPVPQNGLPFQVAPYLGELFWQTQLDVLRNTFQSAYMKVERYGHLYHSLILRITAHFQSMCIMPYQLQGYIFGSIALVLHFERGYRYIYSYCLLW